MATIEKTAETSKKQGWVVNLDGFYSHTFSTKKKAEAWLAEYNAWLAKHPETQP